VFPFIEISHVAGRFVHALQMVAELIPHSDSADLPDVVRISCLEDWFTNHRMLVEFLIIGTPSNCASAQGFVENWKPATTTETSRLRADYGFASEQVSHIGLPKPNQLEQNVAPPILQVKGTFLFDVVQEFVDALKAADHDLADMIEVGLRQAREQLNAGSDRGSAPCA
jgi:hypothetical protein